jgi:hypothetical protein
MLTEKGTTKGETSYFEDANNEAKAIKIHILLNENTTIVSIVLLNPLVYSLSVST